ncbi:MAG: hypothetical protein R6U85_11520 [Salinivirgaceae bacterium]
MHKKWLVALFFILLGNVGFSQYANFRSSYKAVSDSIVFDTLPVINHSVIVQTKAGIIPDKLWTLNAERATLYFSQIPHADSVKISWRIFPPMLSETYFHKNTSLLKQQKIYTINSPNNQRQNLLQQSQIDRSGSISRGFTMGNNQDVTMNSSLNLQLSGKLTDNLSVSASITDANIPVQPDGNTQQLQEFDQIFISVYNDDLNLTLGDYNLKSPTGTFMNVNKNLQGIQFTNKITAGKDQEKATTIKNSLSGAVSKDKYYRQQLTPIEGNQGPYKLNGANNERFIIVIAGSEKVIIDGEHLKRGQQHDYTIDYNSAEITFNPNVAVNSDMRIYVEFEYTDKNYNRYLVANYAEVTHEQTRVWFNVISESDSKNQPIDLDLTTDMVDVLENVGDNTNEAVVPSITEQEFSDNMILYARKDTLVGAETYEMYYYSTNPDSATYRLGFSLVGAGNGNYVKTENLANGKVYRWVAPQNGEPVGSYEPVIQLTAPKTQQLITTGMEMKHGKKGFTRVEMAWSHLDENTFSGLDGKDNHGYAIHYEGLHQIAGDSTTNLSIGTQYQLTHSNFNYFERFRSAEFERDWNVRNMKFNDNEHVATIQLQYNHSKQLSSTLGAQTYIVPGAYEGIKGDGNINISHSRLTVNENFSYLNAATDSTTGIFLRNKATISTPIWKLETGLRQELESNQITLGKTELSSTAYEFYFYEYFIKNKTLENIEAELAANYRKDHRAFRNKMEPEKERRGLTLTTAWNGYRKSTWRLVANYRQVNILNDSLVKSKLPEQHVSARVENRSVLFDGIIRSSTFYEISTGLESKKEYAYLEVEKGQGNYIWIDRNDNEIKELNEFEIAQIAAEGDHIRMYIPTDEYVSVYANRFKQTFDINFRKWTINENFWLKMLSRFSDQLMFSIDQKVTENDFSTYANPFASQQSDTSLISTNRSIRNIFSFNKTDPKFGADIILTENTSKNLLTNGFEGRNQKSVELQTRWNLTQYLTLTNSGGTGEKSKSTAYFTQNNYTISNYKLTNKLRIQPNTTYRFELQYTFDTKENKKGEEEATHHDAGVSFHYAAAQKSTIDAGFHYIDVSFTGTGNNSLTYELLNGLQKGANYTWELQWNKQLSKSFQMSISYNGRAGDDTKTIHIGNMRVRAMF